MKRRGITREHILYALLILPFFEPLSFNLFVRYQFYPSFFSAFADLFQAGRLAAATWAFLYCLRKLAVDRIRADILIVFLFVHVALFPVSCVMNGTFGMKIAGQIYTQLGFILLAAVLLENSPRVFLEACVLVFGILSIAGCASIFLFPKGIIRSGKDYYYLLGGKNTAFPYYFCFLFSLTVLWGRIKRHLPPVGVMILIFIAGAVVSDSSSTTACLAIILLFYLAAAYLLPLLKPVRPWIPVAVLAVIVFSIYMGAVFAPFVSLLRSMGRNATFTGRDTLWNQALSILRENPLFGGGENLLFTLKNGATTNHAHSQYLNRLAKYGLVPFIFLVISLACLVKRLMQSRKILFFNFTGCMVAVYLLHMSFDDYSYNFFLLTVLIANYFAVIDRIPREYEQNGMFSIMWS